MADQPATRYVDGALMAHIGFRCPARAAPAIYLAMGGRAGSAKGATRMVTEAITAAKAAGVKTENTLARGDSAYYGGKSSPQSSKAGPRSRSSHRSRRRAPDLHASVAEVPFTALATTRHAITRPTGRVRVRDANTQDPLFPVWRHHPLFSNTTEPVADGEITHRGHATWETVWSDLIDGPWAYQPSGWFPANAAWAILAALTHNLLHAAGTLTAQPATPPHAVPPCAPTWSTSRPGWPARNTRPCCTCPPTGPEPQAWLTLWTAVFTC